MSAHWKAALTGIVSDRNSVMLISQVEASFIWKDNSVPISLPGSVFMSPLQIELWMVCLEGDHKDTLAPNPLCSRRRRINEADFSTPVAVDQRDSSCLDEAVRSFTVMQNKCRSSRTDVTFCCSLLVFSVVWCLSVHRFQTRITVELFRCTRAAIAR